MDKDEALKLALEALQWNWGGEPLPTLELKAINAIKEALAQPERTWVGLTDEEIKSEAKYFCNGWYSENPERLVLLVKTIQAKLREKNT